MKRIKSDHRGVSLVELVVIIAIITILSATTAGLLALLPRRQVMGCGTEIVSMLDKTRTNAISYNDAWLVLYYTDDGVFGEVFTRKNLPGEGGSYSYQVVSDDAVKIGNHGLKLSYAVAEGDAETELPLQEDGKTSHLIIRYDRSSGAFKSTQLMIKDSATEYDVSDATEISGGPVKEIHVTKGGVAYVASMNKLTGKVIGSMP